ncbi:MAG: hypothetical protein RMX59_020520 [Nostoc sp. DedSLP05]
MIVNWVFSGKNMFKILADAKSENNFSLATTKIEDVPTINIVKFTVAPPLV